MQKPVRWGVLGAANFARHHMAPAIHAAKGADFYALATSSPEKAEPFQEFAPNLKVHSSYEALLADPEVEAIYIPLPNHLHVEWSLKAIEAGKHVLCEKPMTMQAEEFDRLIEARDRSGLLVAEAYMIVHHPQWIRAKELVGEGAIGKLVHVDAAFSYNLLDMDNIRNRPEVGGGSLPDIGVYTFGSTRFVTGEEPEAVEHAVVRRENGVDTFALVTARFPGFTYSGFTSMRMHPRQEVVFHGTEGVLRVAHGPFNANLHDMAQVILETGDNVRTAERWPAANHYVLQVEAFGRTLREGAAYPCPLEFSKGTQRMIDMVLERERAG
ncbi:Oxidoreductase, Gfo/Idh/MocA family [Rubellimicrobium mesophilum DSM 19309]|uniref:Oxidoreductase, Gfo/Idh/MocA family n=1 Tax=Rubellimicrobium mesophilum DSM 19309 TaxID=442562 RepID=A0A017HML9_9RHOB|nr:Gfo/Idh/MocA family oxidoreductase [Rubellimicrobium mesophilum]EYD75418.1 Oxidoreductase, Gfo/Idh/MocA family [Rubellimicrobium mesophilum DSM 19309]